MDAQNGSVVQLVRTPPCHGGGQGFESPSNRHSSRKRTVNADLAHLVERNLAKVEVAGSSPVIRSILNGHDTVSVILQGAMAKW